MSKPNKAGEGERITYSRHDEDDTPWDDSMLVNLWNAQLERQRAGQTSSASSSHMTEEGVDEVMGEIDDADTPTQEPLERRRKLEPRAAGPSGAIDLSSLPTHVQALAQAFYAAGYEAGRFAAAQTPKTSP